jgi:hypothetical protein
LIFFRINLKTGEKNSNTPDNEQYIEYSTKAAPRALLPGTEKLG